FADHCERLAGTQRKGDVLNRLDDARVGEKMRLQMLDLQQSAGGAREARHRYSAFRSLGSSRSRKPSPTICSDSAERMIAMPGNTTSQIAWCANCWPLAIIVPQVGSSGGTPTPRNDSPASASTA